MDASSSSVPRELNFFWPGSSMPKLRYSMDVTPSMRMPSAWYSPTQYSRLDVRKLRTSFLVKSNLNVPQLGCSSFSYSLSPLKCTRPCSSRQKPPGTQSKITPMPAWWHASTKCLNCVGLP